MALDQTLIDAVAEVNRDLVRNADWFPSNTTKLLGFINAYATALALRPSVAAHGGSQAEELRFNMEVTKAELDYLRGEYRRLESRTERRGGFRQNQTSRCGDRW